MKPYFDGEKVWADTKEEAEAFIEGYKVGSKKSTSLPFEVSQQEKCSYLELLDKTLEAIEIEDENLLMENKAKLIRIYRRNDSQVEAALFKRHREKCYGSIKQNPDSLDLNCITGMDWLLEGFIPDNDLTMVWGKAGSGKTTAMVSAANCVLEGEAFLDHSHSKDTKAVLFIAADSGAPPFMTVLQELGLLDNEKFVGEKKNFYVWSSDQKQNMKLWSASLYNCIKLLEFIKKKNIGLVIIDSCKAALSNAEMEYTNNVLVTALLTYFKEVICPYAAVIWLNHDGTGKKVHAGAKAWKEIPSIVHWIKRKDENDKSNQVRTWIVQKSRMGNTRELDYVLEDGVLKYKGRDVDVIGNCFEEVKKIMVQNYLHTNKNEISKAALMGLLKSHSNKTLSNTLTTAIRGKHPEILRVKNRVGHYKLAPRVIDSLGVLKNKNEYSEKLMIESDIVSSLPIKNENMREGNQLKLSDANSSEQISSYIQAPLRDVEEQDPYWPKKTAN